jgi:hypothetical protein
VRVERDVVDPHDPTLGGPSTIVVVANLRRCTPSRRDRSRGRTKFAPASGAVRGGYVLAEAPSGKPTSIIIATGSELDIAVKAWEKLVAEGVQVRLVSMPCTEWFNEQDEAYRASVLPREITARVSDIQDRHHALLQRIDNEKCCRQGDDREPEHDPGRPIGSSAAGLHAAILDPARNGETLNLSGCCRSVDFSAAGLINAPLPVDAQRFIVRFDEELEVMPFRFDLKMSKEPQP